MPRNKGGQRDETTRVIKRYQNRKLYDTRESRYVTLDDITKMIRDGEEVAVLDKRTGHDLTSLTLAQIILEQQKKSSEFLPLGSLRRLIQSGSDSIQEFVGKGVATFKHSKEEVEQFFENIISRGKSLSADEGWRMVQDLLTQVQKGVEDVESAFEKRARSILGRLRSFNSLQKDVDRLEKRIAELEQLLADAQQKASQK